MATMSSNLVAGKAIGGQGGDGKGRFALRAKLAAGVAILGCAGALAFGGLRATSETTSQAAVAPAVSRAQIWSGTCRAGGSDCLLGNDDTAPGVARTMPHGWLGACRAGSSECLPDEEILATPSSPPVGASVTDTYRWDFGFLLAGGAGLTTPTHGTGPADEYTQAEAPGPAATATATTLPDLWDLTIRA
jgi:hypothetical protein